jgi:uncharacterized membrane protein YhfC
MGETALAKVNTAILIVLLALVIYELWWLRRTYNMVYTTYQNAFDEAQGVFQKVQASPLGKMIGSL